MPITRSKSIAEQIDGILRHRIYDEEYPPGSRLPSESELLEEFDVSRATIRTALTKLAAEGLILRKQGDGTYVNERMGDVNTQLGGSWDYWRLIERSGFLPSIQQLSKRTRAATPMEAGALHMAAGDDVVSIKRLFKADGHPVILATNTIGCILLGDLDLADLDAELPIGQLMERFCQRPIAYAIMDIQSTAAGGDVAQLLGRKRGASLLQIRTTFYDRDNGPLVYGSSYIDDTRLSLRLMQTWG